MRKFVPRKPPRSRAPGPYTHPTLPKNFRVEHWAVSVSSTMTIRQQINKQSVITLRNKLGEKKNVINAKNKMQVGMNQNENGEPKVKIGGNAIVNTVAACKEEGEAKKSKKKESGI